MERILVGVDGSSCSQQALEWSARIADRAGLDLVAVRVFEPAEIDVPAEASAQERAEQERELEAWCESLPVSRRPRTDVVTGDAPDALLDAASEHGADLVAVGERGTGGFANLHVGSVAHELVRRTPVPVALVPEGTDARAEHLVVGVDGSEGSSAAVELCTALAAGLDAPVTAVHAFEPFVEWVPADHPDSWRRRAEAEAKTWVDPLAEADVPLDVVIDRDINPAGAIGRTLADRPGSMAVVGTRGLGGFAGLRLGRVPLQLVHEIPAPVIVVPAPSAA